MGRARAGRGPIVIAGGGTAGHVLPGLSIAAELIERGYATSDLRWIGAARGQEATLVPPTGIAVTLLPGRGIQRRLARENLGAIWGLVRAMGDAVLVVRRLRPRAVLTLGGYASVAAALAAVIWRVPLIVAEQNARAGAANRLVGRFARACAVPVAGTNLPHEVVTGNPVRGEVLSEAAHRDVAAARLDVGVPQGRTCIVVFAGSLGARRINEAVAGLVEAWADRSDLFVYHVIGRRDFESFTRPELPDGAGIEYRAVEYESNMPRVLAASDLAICRAGGTSVAELAAIGVPAILVPLPIATRDHQRFNAEALVAAGGAVLVDDAACTADRLADELRPLLDPPGRLAEMAAAARSVGRPDAASAVADLIEEHAR